jgi:hypothetical protein
MQEVEIEGEDLLRVALETSRKRPGNDCEWDHICYGRDHLNPHHCSIVLSESDPSTFPSLVKTPSAQTISSLHLHLNVSIILEISLLQFDPAEDLAQVRLLKAFALFANTHEQHAQ